MGEEGEPLERDSGSHGSGAPVRLCPAIPGPNTCPGLNVARRCFETRTFKASLELIARCSFYWSKTIVITSLICGGGMKQRCNLALTPGSCCWHGSLER